MMHNSLLIQEALRETNFNPLHRSRRKHHQGVRKLDFEELPREGEIKLPRVCLLKTHETKEGELAEARDDLAEFLSLCGFQLADTNYGQGAANTTVANTGGIIRLVIHTDAPEQGFRLSVAADEVELSAADLAGIWAGLVYMERELSLRQAPCLPSGLLNKKPQWAVQISQAPYGSNYLVPDLTDAYLSQDAFSRLIHMGANGMTIYGDWLCYVRSERFPELDCPDYESNIAMLRDAVYRAGQYGIKLYYVAVSPKLASDHPLFQRLPGTRGARIARDGQSSQGAIHNLCSTDGEVLLFHGEVMANLFEEVPGLGGLILIIGGESYYHCFMRPDLSEASDLSERTNCPACKGRTAEAAVNGLLAVTEEAVHAVRLGVPILAWPYSALWSAEPDQHTLIEGLPEGITLLSTIDKDQLVHKNGYSKRIWDYSVEYTGPADNLLKQKEQLEAKGRMLFVKTETALGMECQAFPYMPSMQRHAEKWRNTSAMRPAGVLQAWMFFGMWGSRAEELGWWMNWRPECPNEELLRLMAERDFGRAAAEDVLTAWNHMSEAASFYPCIPLYFIGPEFLGPAHPLIYEGDRAVPDSFTGRLYYLQELEETFSPHIREIRHTLVLDRIPLAFLAGAMVVDEGIRVEDILVREYTKGADAAYRAYSLLSSMKRPAAEPELLSNLEEETLLCEMFYRTFLTCAHTYRFLDLKQIAIGLDDAGKMTIDREIAALAAEELANARAALPLYEKAPWLDLSLRMDGQYPSSRDMLIEKISMLEVEYGSG
ncbi:MAG: hypothetical protein K0R67_3050 [Paenibacillus sp.]|jgi:hypothetical protein|nr:hypothetical protein [Paenibacillus sp.]